MPLYEYQCSCGEKFDAWKPFNLRGWATCPKCGMAASKIISLVNHTFGWRLSDESHIPGHRDELVRDV